MTRQLKSVPPPGDGRERAPDLRDAVKSSLDAMDWTKPSDDALKALALRQADEIEKAADRLNLLDTLQVEAAGDIAMLKRLQQLEAMCDATKLIGWLGPQLQGVLRDLGGTPAARAAMKADKPIGGRLAQLRGEADKSTSRRPADRKTAATRKRTAKTAAAAGEHDT